MKGEEVGRRVHRRIGNVRDRYYRQRRLRQYDSGKSHLNRSLRKLGARTVAVGFRVWRLILLLVLVAARVSVCFHNGLRSRQARQDTAAPQHCNYQRREPDLLPGSCHLLLS